MALHIISPIFHFPPHFLSHSPQFSLQFPPTFSQNPRKPFHQLRAFREWREYEDAVKRKDLSGALSFLKSLETEQKTLESFGEDYLSSLAESTRSRFRELERFGPQKDWEILDTCLNADDMKLVGNAYKFLRDRGFLPNFGKCRNMVLEGPRNVTPDVLTASTGLEVTKLAPKKWGLSDSSSTVLVAFLGTVSFLISQGVDLRPNLAVILGLATVDSIFLGGTCLAQISSYWPPYRRRILIHEAGHLLTAYLMGCPIRGVVLDPIVAMQMGIQGQGLNFGMRKLPTTLPKDDLMAQLLTGTAWYSFLALQPKLLFMVRQRVEKMMKIYLEAYVFFLSLRYL
ncbi:PREDICTED: uncharacterized protein LOC109357285 isoform X2 [Lupinus angustifolius]|uniref:uncharacterized protein LOC109357285 isoform X2 n=1 Tax=Lupinus angustifolius TaxID=3871 RepID=UPI00092EB81A|nr:PREDICTED: uncharacterized protein LOC109357285 isoform X2 [Lupinus angustifolius]